MFIATRVNINKTIEIFNAGDLNAEWVTEVLNRVDCEKMTFHQAFNIFVYLYGLTSTKKVFTCFASPETIAKVEACHRSDPYDFG